MNGGPLRTAIVGCGLIGQRRAHTMTGAMLVACADVDEQKARAFAASAPGCLAFTDWRTMLMQSDCDTVVVATHHDTLAEIAAAAASSGRHVLVEKPAGRSVAEIDAIAKAARRSQVCVRVGFNHRYHRGLRKARELVDTGVIGELMYIRGFYGHGGRLGYESEWRADRKRSGGGELIDQGPHLIDLARWFLGEFVTVQGLADTFYWDMPVDDNAFLLLRAGDGKTAFLHVSWTEWKNAFSLEIFGKAGKIHVGGLGGSYGPERVVLYRMLPGMGPPETTAWDYPMPDDSWTVEFAQFVEDVRCSRMPAVGLADARAVLSVIERVYRDCGHDYRT
jgi:predicted dehydrogenase